MQTISVIEPKSQLELAMLQQPNTFTCIFVTPAHDHIRCRCIYSCCICIYWLESISLPHCVATPLRVQEITTAALSVSA